MNRKSIFLKVFMIFTISIMLLTGCSSKKNAIKAISAEEYGRQVYEFLEYRNTNSLFLLADNNICDFNETDINIAIDTIKENFKDWTIKACTYDAHDGFYLNVEDNTVTIFFSVKPDGSLKYDLNIGYYIVANGEVIRHRGKPVIYKLEEFDSVHNQTTESTFVIPSSYRKLKDGDAVYDSSIKIFDSLGGISENHSNNYYYKNPANGTLLGEFEYSDKAGIQSEFSRLYKNKAVNGISTCKMHHEDVSRKTFSDYLLFLPTASESGKLLELLHLEGIETSSLKPVTFAEDHMHLMCDQNTHNIHYSSNDVSLTLILENEITEILDMMVSEYGNFECYDEENYYYKDTDDCLIEIIYDGFVTKLKVNYDLSDNPYMDIKPEFSL